MIARLIAASARVILGKALGVLPETQLLQPVRNLLHRATRRFIVAD